jgi:Ca-activated chloride channel homolog
MCIEACAAPVTFQRPASILQQEACMRFHTYTKFSPEMADAVDLQALLDKLADFLLQSGFAGGKNQQPYYGWDFGEDGDRSMEALRQAILNALMESGQFTPEMLEALRGDTQEGSDAEASLAQLLDQIVQRLTQEGYLNVQAPPQMPAAQQPVTGRGSLAQKASKDVQFQLTDKGIDFLGYKSLRHILSSLGKSSFGSHDTPHLATGIEADGYSKEYEFGDVLNMDVNETLKNSLLRTGSLEVPMDIDYHDLMVRQAEYRSSCATVLMLDTSHSMILYGEDRFTPAKKVALALTHLIRTQFPGDTLQVVLFHDSAEEIPLSTLPQAQVGPYHTNTAEGLKLARRLLMAQKKDMRQIVMITDGKPSAMTMPNGQIYKNSMGLDSTVIATTLREVANCRRAGILINTFMLARDRALVEFVKRVSEISKGKAYFTNTMTLGQFILMDFLRKKTQKIS